MSWWERNIMEPGKLPLLLCALAFVVTFGVTRVIVRMIRAGKGPIKNVKAGGLHVHHVVPGTILMVASGILALSTPSVAWTAAAGVIFGIGTALVLDEFSLILHLDDVYWSEKGRLSVDAVFLAGGVILLLLVGASPLGVNDLSEEHAATRWALFANLAFTMATVVITLLKGKYVTGVIGLILPVVALVAALRLARPGSPWARWLYLGRPKKLARAERRAARFDNRWTRRRRRVQEAVAGAPTR